MARNSPYTIRELLRSPLKRLRRNVRVRIPEGPNAGLVVSRGTFRSYRRGDFESARLSVIEGLIRAGECFWDLGAHHGYVSMLASRRVGPAGLVCAMEPSYESFGFLAKHIAWNNLSNTRAMSVALGAEDGTARFGGQGSRAGKLLADGKEVVEVRSAQSLIVSGECARPTFVKCDVEGAELDVLRGFGDHLFSADALFFIGTHSQDLHESCVALLREHGFQVHESGSASALRTAGWPSGKEADVLAVGPDRSVPEESLRALSAL